MNAQAMFTVKEMPIFSDFGKIHNKKGLFVDEKCINIVSDKYEIHQPKEILATFTSVAERTGLEISTVKTNSFNGGMLISAKYSECFIADDKHDINLVFYTSHCGKYRTFLTLNALRIACFNQVPVLYKNQNRFIVAEKHYQNALDVNMIERVLENIPASVAAYKTRADRLKDVRLTEADFVEWYVKQMKWNEDSKQFDSKVAKLRAVYRGAEGQDVAGDNTAWKGFNAVTYINTHGGKNTALREENALIKGGDLSLKLFDNLFSLAA